jgi:crossover junction endodeoxyribonuclease RuvC
VIYIGIDPGVDGAVAVFDPQHHTLRVVDMPCVTLRVNRSHRQRVSAALLASDLAPLAAAAPSSAVRAWVEEVGAMPGQGVASMFAFGKSAGIIEGVLAGLGFSYSLVPPPVWKRATRAGVGKDAARARAAQLFPHQADLFRRAKDHGRADAALIAFYGAEFGNS